LVEVPRSGATFLAAQLNRHPQIFIGWESNFMVRLLRRLGDRRVQDEVELSALLDDLLAERKLRDWKLSRAELLAEIVPSLPIAATDLIRAILRHSGRRARPAATVLGIKKGSYLKALPELARAFPHARFVHVLRDGRAVFNSQRLAVLSETGQPFESSARRGAKRWSKAVAAFRSFAAEYPERAFEVRYESLIANRAKTLAALFAFIGVDPDAELSMPERAGDYVPERFGDLHKNVGSAPRLDRIEAWRAELPALERRIFEYHAASWLRAENYDVDSRLRVIAGVCGHALSRIGAGWSRHPR
jgi:hypothetical protein